MVRALALLVLLLAACRVEHGLDRPPADFREAPPPKLQVKQSFDPDTGKLAHEWTQLVFVDRRPLKDGREVKYFANGEKLCEGEWKHGEKHGAWRFYYESGAIKSETFYGDRRTPTTMTFWHPNGQISLQGPAINGSRQGTWRLWRKNGLLAEEGPFVGSVREGAWRVWSEDGQSVSEIVYSKNVRVSASSPTPSEPVWAEPASAPRTEDAPPEPSSPPAPVEPK
ncbi:MAG: toxin-antitoxin system YwqK family antitoxin [Planctomycetes bacterium]|nr:toxin-antitoxin system YwqK family antitoxin [Planctomycetota bacterium]